MEPMHTSQQIAIIGAGIGGLASGHFLREAGRDVAIYERAPIPGGRIQLLEREGARIDVGTQYFHTNYVETLKLLSALDLEDQLLPIRAPVMLMRSASSVRRATPRRSTTPSDTSSSPSSRTSSSDESSGPP